MSVPIHVLSLVDAVERRKTASAEFVRHGLDYRFVDAIDGRLMTDSEIDLHYDGYRNARNFKRPLSREEIACALGHRAIWRQVAEGPAPVALVCEDDLLLHPGFNEFFRSLAGREALFDHVLVKLDGAARSGQVVCRLADVDLVLTRRVPGRTTGYLLGKSAATALLARAGKISRPVDIDLKHYWEHGVPILVARPQHISEQPKTESGMEISRVAVKPLSFWRRMSRNLRYQWAMSLGRLHSPLRAANIPVLCEMRKKVASDSI